MKATLFSAPGPAAGYLWQVRRALLTLFDLLPGGSVELESRDDIVTFNVKGEMTASIQAKHSIDPVPGTLTTESPDLWKTLRVWADPKFQPDLAPDTKLVLLTTDQVGTGSCLAAFRDGKTPSAAQVNLLVQELDQVAKAAGNSKLSAAYSAWRKLKPISKRSSLVSRIRIADAAARLSLTNALLEERLERWPLRAEVRPVFADELQGWFLSLVSERLGGAGARVTHAEFMTKARVINDRIKPAVLAVRHAAAPTPTLAEEWANSPTYLRQLKLIGVADAEQELAVANYWRARAELDDWRQAGVLCQADVEQFESDLLLRWRTVNLAAGRSASGATPAAKDPVAHGQHVFDTCMAYQAAMLQQQVGGHVVCGVYHMLADVPRLGWHPDYVAKLGPKAA